MTNTEKVKHIRDITFSSINKIDDTLARSNEDVASAVELRVKEKQADANEMANRTANTKDCMRQVEQWKTPREDEITGSD